MGSSHDSTYFGKFANVATIVNTYSPTRDAMQVALEHFAPLSIFVQKMYQAELANSG
jgi:hypothetical protein